MQRRDALPAMLVRDGVDQAARRRAGLRRGWRSRSAARVRPTVTRQALATRTGFGTVPSGGHLATMAWATASRSSAMDKVRRNGRGAKKLGCCARRSKAPPELARLAASRRTRVSRQGSTSQLRRTADASTCAGRDSMVVRTVDRNVLCRGGDPDWRSIPGVHGQCDEFGNGSDVQVSFHLLGAIRDRCRG